MLQSFKRMISECKKINITKFLSIYIVLCLIGIIYIAKNYGYRLVSETANVDYTSYIDSMSAVEADGNVYSICGQDANMIFNFLNTAEGGIYGFDLALGETHPDITVYYSDASGIFSETKKIELSDTDRISIQKKNPFSYLRIDLEEDFEIKDLSILETYQLKRYVDIVKILMMVGVNFILTSLVTFLLCPKWIIRETSIKKSINAIKEKLTSKNTIVNLAVIAVSLIIGIIVDFIFCKLSRYSINYKNIIVICIGVMILFLILHNYKHVLNQLHVFAFIAITLLGIAWIFVCPETISPTWDSDTHFGRVDYIAEGLTGEMSPEAYFIVYQQGTGFDSRIKKDEDIQKELLNQFVEEYRNEATFYGKEEKFELVDFVYMPAALGVFAGEVIGLPYLYSFALGKVMFLLTYALLIAIAVYKVPQNGKLTMAIIGLLPTMVFMASEYSYDWFVVAMAMIGYAEFLRLIHTGHKISNVQMLRVVLLLVIALIPKAIYMPLLLPLAFLKNDKYENPLCARIIVIIGVAFLCCTFMIPLLIGTFESDSRGGSDVDAVRQIIYVLHNPLDYTKLLTKTIADYVSIENSAGYTVFLGCLGHIKGAVTIVVLMLITGFIDGMDSEGKVEFSLFYRGFSLIVVYGTLALAASSMYFAFTPVGSNVINGFQARYIIPVLFPLIYLWGQNRFKTNIASKNKWAVLVLLCVSFVFLRAVMENALMY